MHSVTLQRLDKAEATARQDNNPHRYLEELSPLHVNWHGTSSAGRRVGFLIFHWHVVDHFQNLQLDKTLGVTAYKAHDFNSPGGRFGEADWSDAMRGAQGSKSLDELVAFSGAIEAWHNEAHMVIGMETGAPMMDPARNVFYAPFWNLHEFINKQFVEELHSYAKAANLAAKSAADIVAELETNHHALVRRI